MLKHRLALCLVSSLAAAGLSAASFEDARALYDRGSYAEAEAELRRVLKDDRADAKRLLGLTLIELERFEEASPILDEARAAAPEDSGVLIGLSRVEIARQNWDNALPLLNKVCATEAENPTAYFYRGIVQARRSDFAAAVNDLEKSLSLKPDMAKAHYYAGLAYNGLKKPDKMVEHFQMFLKMEPDAPEAARVRSLLRSLL